MSAGTCWECGSLAYLHEHHVIPRSQGGTRTVALCEKCHGLVHSRNMSISQLTKDALAKKRSDGVRLGRPTVIPEETVQRARQMRSEGMTLRAVAEQFIAEGIPTGHGGVWSAGTVKNLTKRVYER